MEINEQPERVDVRGLLLTAPTFLGPLLVIIILFMRGFSPLYVSFWAIVSILAMSFIRKGTRPSLKVLIVGLVNGAKLGSQVAISTALIGMVIKVITLTGLGITVPQIMRGFCGQNLLLLLIMTGVISIILGTGLPAATSYILVAVVIAPMLINLGVPMITAHLYCFYFCNFSYITPPVALAAIFASKLAGASYLRTGVEASKVGIGGFIIPFLIVFSPALLLDFSESLDLIILKSVSAVITLIGIQAAIVGYFSVGLGAVVRIVYVCSVFVALTGVFFSSLLLLAAGIVFFGGLTLWQYLQGKKRNENTGQLRQRLGF